MRILGSNGTRARWTLLAVLAAGLGSGCGGENHDADAGGEDAGASASDAGPFYDAGPIGRDAFVPDAIDTRGFLTLRVAPDRVSLVGPGAGRALRAWLEDPQGNLRPIPADALLLVAAEETSTVAEARGGRVRALGPGRAQLTLSAGALRASLEVNVGSESPFASSVLERSPGSGGGFGAERLPEVVLGPPEGAGPFQGSLEVLSLGSGGTITVGFEGVAGYDGPGADLIVFENPFRFGEFTFAEPAYVGCAFEAGALVELPCDPRAWPFPGCAGVWPVLASSADPSLDATDPAEAGGDPIDLASRIPRFDRVRIRDVGSSSVAPGMIAGFDLDAVALIHAWPSDVEAIRSEPAALELRVGERRLLPRVDAIRPSGARVYGIEAEASAPFPISGGMIEATETGTGAIEFRAGDFRTRVSVTIRP